MQNLVSHNLEICHKFVSKYSGAVYFTKTVFNVKFVAKIPTSQKGCATDSTQWAQAAGWCRRTVSMQLAVYAPLLVLTLSKIAKN